MGTYLIISNNEGNLTKCKEIYDKHFAIKSEQFLNDFGDINTFDDIFDIRNEEEIWLKIGVGEREFYTPKFMEDILKLEGVRGA